MLFVALEGLEPSLKVPETCVLPLHHKAVSCRLLLDTAKLQLLFELTKIITDFFKYPLIFLCSCVENS